MTIFLCDDTMEGIFTAVYDAWASRLGHANVKLQVAAGRWNCLLITGKQRPIWRKQRR